MNFLFSIKLFLYKINSRSNNIFVDKILLSHKIFILKIEYINFIEKKRNKKKTKKKKKKKKNSKIYFLFFIYLEKTTFRIKSIIRNIGYFTVNNSLREITEIVKNFPRDRAASGFGSWGTPFESHWSRILAHDLRSVLLQPKTGRNVINEPAHDKTYNKTCVRSKDSDQPVHPPNMPKVLVYSSLDSPGAVEGTCDQRRLWSDCADAQADLSLRWSHVFLRICRALAQIPIIRKRFNALSLSLTPLHLVDITISFSIWHVWNSKQAQCKLQPLS